MKMLNKIKIKIGCMCVFWPLFNSLRNIPKSTPAKKFVTNKTKSEPFSSLTDNFLKHRSFCSILQSFL